MREIYDIVAFGAHPDDVEFSCGAVIAAEVRAGRSARLVICSRGESGTSGSPDERTAEAGKAADLLGAALEFIEFGGDARFEVTAAHRLALAAVIRRLRPSIVLAPSTAENQHPDHRRLGEMVRDAARMARYGGVPELKSAAAHAIDALLFYAVTVEAEPRDLSPLMVDVSDKAVVAAWTASMEAHASQLKSRNYVELQLARAVVNGARCGVDYAISLFPNDPLVVESLGGIRKTARRF